MMSYIAPVSTHLAEVLHVKASELLPAGAERWSHWPGDIQTGNTGHGLVVSCINVNSGQQELTKPEFFSMYTYVLPVRAWPLAVKHLNLAFTTKGY